MYFNGMFNLDSWDPDAKFIILDDMPLRFIKNPKGFLGAQAEFEITDKYRSKMNVKWGKPCIYLSNTELANQDLTGTDMDLNWLRVNTIEVILLDGVKLSSAIPANH